MIQMSSCFFEEKTKDKIHDELLKFINDVKTDLDIAFPLYVNYSLINAEIINAIVNKKLKDSINTKLLYCYNDNTKIIIGKISPFVFSKRLEFSINNFYIFIRDSYDFLVIDMDGSSFNDPNKSKEFSFNDGINEHGTIQNNYDEKIDSAHMVYSNNKSLVLYMKSFFKAVWIQKETCDNMIEEKSHSDLLVDLITHDIGNHHGIVQGGLDMIYELIKEKLDYIVGTNSRFGGIDNSDAIDSDVKNYADNNVDDNNSMSTNDSKSAKLYEHDKKTTVTINEDFLKDLLSYVSTVQGALDKSQSLVKNIIKLERMYRQKVIHLYKKNIIDSIEESKEVFNDTYVNYPIKNNGKKINLDISIDKRFKEKDINIMADDLLKEIFINIFSNSIKYSDEYTTVPIHISITEYGISDAKYWMILVSDYGKGIPDSVKEGLFERFYSKASGSGLGLSIVRSLIKRYNGRVWASDRVASSYTEGVTIGMIFPVWID
jgi:signal transduction histidine kinase